MATSGRTRRWTLNRTYETTRPGEVKLPEGPPLPGEVPEAA